MSSSSSLTADTPSGWHSIRPWNAQLSLVVREVTSVSVTFVLATDPSSLVDSDLDASLAVLGFNAAAEDDTGDPTTSDDAGNDGEEPEASSSSSKPRSLINEKLANGLRVNVNQVAWQRVFIRVDEKVDEAVIIVYGLMPGRQYDIDLALAQPGQHIRHQILTFEENADPDSTSENSTDPESNSSSSDAHQTVSTPSTSPSRTIPNTPPPPNNIMLSSDSSSSSSSSMDSSPPQISLEERLSQLHHSLSLINAERENLTASLKSARKESQKAEAALRSEMEALKRASEKHTAGEVRSRQKILALQEAVKRAQAATKDTEALVQSMESELPVLLKQKQEKETEYEKVKQNAEKARKARAKAVENDRKKQESMRTELQSLTIKLEKLTTKKEKHESITIPELEQQLSAMEKDIEEQERLLLQLDMNQEFEDVNRLALSAQQQYFGYGRARHQSLGPGPIGRPSPAVAPIQRPTFSNPSTSQDFSSSFHNAISASSSSTSKLWSPPQLRHTPSTGSTARASSLQYHPHAFSRDQPPPISSSSSTGMIRQPSSSTSGPIIAPPQPPTILTNPARQNSLKSTNHSPREASPPVAQGSSNQATPSQVAPPPMSRNVPLTTSVSGSSQGSSTTNNSSTLSGRAPAFEPGKLNLGRVGRPPGLPGVIGAGRRA